MNARNLVAKQHAVSTTNRFKQCESVFYALLSDRPTSSRELRGLLFDAGVVLSLRQLQRVLQALQCSRLVDWVAGGWQRRNELVSALAGSNVVAAYNEYLIADASNRLLVINGWKRTRPAAAWAAQKLIGWNGQQQLLLTDLRRGVAPSVEFGQVGILCDQPSNELLVFCGNMT